MDETELKAAYAAFLLEQPDTASGRFAAALKLYPAEQDTGRACQISFSWPSDPVVILEIERLRKDGVGKPNSKVPTKEQVIELLWQMAANEKVPPKDRATSSFMIARMMKYVDDGESVDSKRMPTAPVYKVVSE